LLLFSPTGLPNKGVDLMNLILYSVGGPDLRLRPTKNSSRQPSAVQEKKLRIE
jgi:hypothetical protein